MGRHRIPLQNTTDARRYIGSIINRMEDGTLDPKLGGKLAYAANFLVRALELECIEKRLLRLEDAADRREAIDVTPTTQQLTGGT